MNEKVIDLHDISKTFGGAKALKKVNFDLFKGEVHCLIGQNGCGKSTLIKIIAGVITQDSGAAVNIDGVSVIYQDLSLFPNLSVGENIYFPLYREKGRINKNALRAKAAEILEQLNVQLDLDIKVSELSVADRQLVAIARSMVTKSRILIMDEPTSSLTKNEVRTLFELTLRLKAEGVSIIFVSHKLDEIIDIADRITVMRDGQMLKTINNGEADENQLTYLISGEKIALSRKSFKKDESCLLEIKDFNKDKQFKDISFTLNKGEVLGIIGQLGSGRTELALSIFGMNRRDSGEMKLYGEPVDFGSNKSAIKAGIAYVPEDRIMQGVAIDQSVEMNLTEAALKRFKGKAGLLSKARLRSCTEQWTERLGIKSAAPGMRVSGLSGGNQQKVVLAKWLETDPRILILDQPTNGIDIGAKSAIYEIIGKLSDSGMGIILISDEPQEIYYNCNKMLIMKKGEIRRRVDLADISQEEFEALVKDEGQ